jgi:hypothetical protein
LTSILIFANLRLFVFMFFYIVNIIFWKKLLFFFNILFFGSIFWYYIHIHFQVFKKFHTWLYILLIKIYNNNNKHNCDHIRTWNCICIHTSNCNYNHNHHKMVVTLTPITYLQKTKKFNWKMQHIFLNHSKSRKT